MFAKRTATDLDATQIAVIEAALPHVVFDGWSVDTLREAARDAGVDPVEAKRAFPRGGVDMTLGFHRMADMKLREELAGSELSSMRIRDRITHCVRRRIELVGRDRETVRRGATLLALPLHTPEGARAMWQTADIIWTACGDTATDYNWYSKRLILSGVYSSTVLFWLGDQDPDFHPTWEFLDRRIEGVMQFEKTKAQLKDNPVARAAFALPAGLLGMIKAPGARG